MDYPLEEHIAAYIKPDLELINSTPVLLSVLYDAGLLPEQVTSMRSAMCMVAVVEAYRMGQASASCEVE